MAAGEVIGCFGLTEPDSGSDPGAMRTTARRDGDGWVLNGTKMWITNGVHRRRRRRVGAGRGRHPGFHGADRHAGVRGPHIRRKLSLRASVTSELVLYDCRVPADAVLPDARGLKAPLSCLTEARFGIVWGAVGAARACCEAALDYATTREQFGRPIGGFQLTQAKLVDMARRGQQGRACSRCTSAG